MSAAWFVFAGLAVALTLAAAVRRYLRRGTPADLGNVSEGWLSEQRGRKNS